MSKERLEKAKKILNHIKGYGIYDGNDDIEIFEWLIEQAERVQELEEERDEWKYTAQSYYMTNQELREQNKRYREALEEILAESYEEAGLHPDTNMQLETFIAKTARQALE